MSFCIRFVISPARKRRENEISGWRMHARVCRNRFSRAFPALAGPPSAFLGDKLWGEDLVRSSFFPFLVDLRSRKWMWNVMVMERRVARGMGTCWRNKCSNDGESMIL